MSKITYAGSNTPSYQQAEADLQALAELTVTDKQVRRVCKRVGGERLAERAAAAAAYEQLPLVKRKGAPAGVVAPGLAVVGTDGGRLQIFERPPRAATGVAVASPAADGVEASAVSAATGPPPGVVSVDQPATAGEEDAGDERRGRFWREDKIGVLLTMTSVRSEDDPCPEIPATFLNPARMSQLVRELKKRAPPHAEAAVESPEPAAQDEALRDNAAGWQPPEVQAKQVVATRRPWSLFAPLVAAAAWSLGFFAAERRAFIGDGADNNWTLHRERFSSFVPILDFIHALSYVFAAALAGRGFREGWGVYERWIGWLWSGAVAQVLVELTARQAEVGAPAADEPAGSARAVVSRALTYLHNNQERMHYADYRRQGLPITTSYVESTVKQMNYRVKGTEKFWNEEGAEELLQLRADYLSDGEVMPNFWKRREAKETGQNRYHRAE